ncbi:MAG: peptidase M61, partial [Lysobacteraceae bacterium]
YKDYSRLFRQATPPPYGVFLRYNPINAGGGVAMHRSFVVTFGSGAGSDVAKLRMTLAHEMFHTFQPRINDPDGLASAWFTEGLATFYQRRLPLRYGMITPSAFLDDLNYYAGRYYTNVMATVPNAAIPTRFWSDTRIRTLPYDRGMFYFATVDEAIRLRSGGKRSMDDAMFAMLALQAAGKSTRYADWEAILTREIGPGAVADFRASLAGRMQLASSSAFGPCFRRISKPLRRYELGFDTAVLAEPKRTVRGLVSGSAAALAGLRNGDDIVDPVPQDRIQGDQTERLTLKVRRDGKTFAIAYLPRGETVSASQWERTAGVPDKRCAL